MTKLIHESIMPFGKYKGQTMQYILDREPGYILWLDKNAKDVVVSNSLYQYAKAEQQDRMQPDYYDVIGDDWGDRDEY